MGAPKRKHPEPHPPARPPTKAEREAAEERADAEELEKATAEWEADGRPAGVPLDEVKREFGVK